MLEQILNALKIEIPQLITHIIGFVLAVWILKRYAWKPILALLDERRERIRKSFEEIEAKHQTVDQIRSDYEGKLKAIDAEARKRLTEAVAEGEKIAGRIKETARDEAKQIVVRAREEVERDVAKARVALKQDMVTMALSATEKIIHERLDDQKHRQLVGRFIDELEGKA